MLASVDDAVCRSASRFPHAGESATRMFRNGLPLPAPFPFEVRNPPLEEKPLAQRIRMLVFTFPAIASRSMLAG